MKHGKDLKNQDMLKAVYKDWFLDYLRMLFQLQTLYNNKWDGKIAINDK